MTKWLFTVLMLAVFGSFASSPSEKHKEWTLSVYWTCCLMLSLECFLIMTDKFIAACEQLPRHPRRNYICAVPLQLHSNKQEKVFFSPHRASTVACNNVHIENGAKMWRSFVKNMSTTHCDEK